MKIYFINRFFYPDLSATSQMLSDLAFALAARGYKITVITSSLSYDGSRRFKRREIVQDVEVIRLFTTGFGRDRLSGRFLDYFTFYLSAATVLLRRLRRGDLVVAKTDPPALSILAAPICALKGALSINWLQDIFPETAQVLGMGRGRLASVALSLLRGLRNASLRNAAFNVVIGGRMAEKVRSLGVGKNRYAIIQNWADGRFVKPIPREHNRLRRLWGLEDAFVVGYSGNLGRAHEIQTFLSAIESLESGSIAPGSAAPSAPNILWLFTGGGALMNQLKQEVRRRQLLSVIFRPYQPQETLCESLSLPDVHLVSLRPELEGLIVPSKFYGIAAAGRPVIFVGDPDGEVARLIRTYRSGFSVREEDGAGLADAVMTLIENPELAAELGCRARESFQAELDFRYALKRWEDLIARSHATVGGAGL